MSDAGQEPREWRFYVNAMMNSSRKSNSLPTGWIKTPSSAMLSPNDATLRNLELIGEAATHIPE